MKKGAVSDLARQFEKDQIHNAEKNYVQDTSSDQGLQDNSKSRMEKGMLAQFERNLQQNKIKQVEENQAKLKQAQLDQDYLLALALQEEYFRPEYQ